MTTEERFRLQAVAVALRKMLDTRVARNHFCICTLRTCLETAGITVSKHDMLPFEAIHCVNWSDMPVTFRQDVQRQLLDIFKRSPDFQDMDIEAIVLGIEPVVVEAEVTSTPTAQPKRTLFQKLLGN